MSEKLIATDLWVLQAQETIQNQQATIDRLTDQRDRLLSELKRATKTTYSDTQLTDWNALIAEIEAGK